MVIHSVMDTKMYLKTTLILCIIIADLLTIQSVAMKPKKQRDSILDISKMTFSKPGDINIGAIFSARICSGKIGGGKEIISRTEEINFAVDVVNKDPNLLPNITLGFIIRPTCLNHKSSTETSLSFLPQVKSLCNKNLSHTHSALHNDVIGVMAPFGRKLTIPMSILYGVAQLPLMGHTTTRSDEFSQKLYHPYFFRVVPPNSYAVRALLKFVNANGWSYISVLYTSGPFGQNAFDNLKANGKNYGICIATSHRMPNKTKYDEIVLDLIQHPKARAVVVFADVPTFRNILKAAVDQNASGHFIWLSISPDGNQIRSSIGEIKNNPAIGAFTFDVPTTKIPEYYEFLGNQTLTSTKNPWLRLLWEKIFECSFKKGTCDENANLLQSNAISTNEGLSLKLDSVLAFAHAAHNLLSDNCPTARGTEARSCITGELLLEYLKKVNFEGYSGHLEFDRHQDVLRNYLISQYVNIGHKDPFIITTNRKDKQRLVKKKIAAYHVKTDTITYFNDTISWSHLNTVPRIVPLSNTSTASIDIPESVCSRPCLIYEYKIEKELPCCWECRVCRENERIASGNTSCERCPEFEWPDESTGFRTCSPIAPYYLKPNHYISIIVISFATFFIFVAILILIGYIIYRNERVVKAGSRELSLLQFIAIFSGYATVLVFQVKPTDSSCGVMYFQTSMSFVCLYSPLLVKTIRIYRIFNYGSKQTRPLHYTNPQSQIIMTITLIVFQAFLCSVTYVIAKPKAQKHQPVKSEKFVELTCAFTVVGLATFLVYSLILVFLCSIFAFKTRKLPDDFKESRFISMCVATTMVIWFAFIPTYFTANSGVVRVLLMSNAILLNHTVALLFLFVPKLYAAKFVRPTSRSFSVARTETNSM